MASLDLKALTFDSQWRLEAKPRGAGRGRQAAARRSPCSIAGPSRRSARSSRASIPAALEQELSARKIERDVEELERLRRIDERAG